MIITKDVDKKQTKFNRVLLLIYESVNLDVRVVVHKSSKDKICLCMNNRFIFKPSNTTKASLHIFTSQVLFELTRHLPGTVRFGVSGVLLIHKADHSHRTDIPWVLQDPFVTILIHVNLFKHI